MARLARSPESSAPRTTNILDAACGDFCYCGRRKCCHRLGLDNSSLNPKRSGADSSRVMCRQRKTARASGCAGRARIGGRLSAGPELESPRGCEPSASTHAGAVSHQLGNRGGACTFYTILLSQESSTAGERRFGENSSLLHASRTLPRPSYQAWSGARSRPTIHFGHPGPRLDRSGRGQ